jgi:hypothetical protein
MVIAVGGKFAKIGAQDIDVLVHSIHEGHASPCAVIVGSSKTVVGGTIGSLDEMLVEEIRKRPGYTLKEAFAIVKA